MKVVIKIWGGFVQEVEKDNENIKVEVHDYDVEGLLEDDCSQDEKGRLYSVQQY